MDTALIFHSFPFLSTCVCSRTELCSELGARVVGTEGPSRMGSPMSTVMVSGFISGTIGPARVFTLYDLAVCCEVECRLYGFRGDTRRATDRKRKVSDTS